MRWKNPKYDLKLKQKKTLELALIISLILVAGVFLASKEFQFETRIQDVEHVTIKVEDIPPNTDQITRPPPPARPTIPVEDIGAELEPDITIPEMREYIPKGDLPRPPVVMENEVFDFHKVERPPELIGGYIAISDYIRKHDLYPSLARTAESSGYAVIQFTVDKDGHVVDAVVAGEKPSGLGFGEAALTAMNAMTFHAGMQRDRAVAVRMQQIISFKMK